MSVEQYHSGVIDKRNKISRPLWERQIHKILTKHPLASTRETVARKLAQDWNTNIGNAHEHVKIKDAKDALKEVEKNDRKALKVTPERPPLTPFLYELEGSDELRTIVIKREQESRNGALHSIKRPKKPQSMVYIWPIDTNIQPLSVSLKEAQAYKWKEEDLAPQKKDGMSMFQLARSGFSLPRLPGLYDSPLTKIAESGFQLPAIETVSKPNFKQRLS